MKILRYRTIAYIYPHFSLEVEVENGDDIVYVNIDVNNVGKPTEVLEDNNWAYIKPLDEVYDACDADTSLVCEDFTEVLNQMVAFWNKNPVWHTDSAWRKWDAE